MELSAQCFLGKIELRGNKKFLFQLCFVAGLTKLFNFQIFVKDVWKEYTGWPLNDMEGQYKFMVKHVQLWNVAFHSTSPRWIHSVYLAAIAAYYARYIPIPSLLLLWLALISNFDY